MTDRPTPLTDQQLNEYAVLAATAAVVGDKVNPAVVNTLIDEIRRLQAQRRYLMNAIRRKDARTGAGDRALREFLTNDAAAAAVGGEDTRNNQ